MCRNCVKSKRECLGYDPAQKSQPSHSIQPAPNAPPSLVVNPQEPAPQLSAPAGYTPAGAQHIPSSSLKSPDSPAVSTEQVDQSSAIDTPLPSISASDMTSLQSAVEGNLQPQVNATSLGPAPPTDSSNNLNSFKS